MNINVIKLIAFPINITVMELIVLPLNIWVKCSITIYVILG